MSKFSSRLKELRAELGLSQQNLSNETKTTKTSINIIGRAVAHLRRL